MIIDILKLSIIVLLLDAIYLGLFSSWFNNVVNSIQGSDLKLDYLGAALCYILIVFSLKFFAINKKFNYMETFLLGFCIYGIFDLTNKAIFKKKCCTVLQLFFKENFYMNNIFFC